MIQLLQLALVRPKGQLRPPQGAQHLVDARLGYSRGFELSAQLSLGTNHGYVGPIIGCMASRVRHVFLFRNNRFTYSVSTLLWDIATCTAAPGQGPAKNRGHLQLLRRLATALYEQRCGAGTCVLRIRHQPDKVLVDLAVPV